MKKQTLEETISLQKIVNILSDKKSPKKSPLKISDKNIQKWNEQQEMIKRLKNVSF